MSLIAANSGVVVCGEFRHRELSQLHGASGQSLLIWPKTAAFWSGGSRKRECLKTQAFWSDVSKPSAVEMEAINDSDQLDRILGEAQQLSQPILIDWMASWCRKCIYLKPKLEKLAAEFDSKVKFYCVDVNKVPQNLVKRGNISKMPTIQVWKDGEMKEEVIGGQKAWVVIEEVSKMLKKYV